MASKIEGGAGSGSHIRNNSNPNNSAPDIDGGTGLIRGLGFFSSVSVVMGAVIGSGVFLVASDMAKSVGSVGWGLSAWVVAGLVSFIGGLIFAELGAMFPRAGGQYVYLKEAFHPLVGFLYGWCLFAVIQCGSIAAVAIAFSNFLSQLVPLSATELKIYASLAIAALSILNAQGLAKGSKFLDWITSFKVLALAVIALIGAGIYFSGMGETLLSRFLQDTESANSLTGESLAKVNWNFSDYGVALIAAFWSFDGWNNLSFVAGEIKNPKKNIPRAFGVGILLITLLYVVVNLSYSALLPLSMIANSSNVAATWAQVVGGPTGVKVMSLLIALSALGCVNGMILTGARVVYAMSADRSFPSVFAKIHPTKRSPNAALYLQMIWTLVLVWSGTYDQLYTYVVFAAFLFYGLAGYGLLRLRKKAPKLERPFRTPLTPILPLFYVLFIVAFCANAAIEKPVESLTGVAIVALGLPIFLFFKRKQKTA